MKKIKAWALLLALFLSFGLVACDSDDNGADEADTPDVVEEDEDYNNDEDTGDDEEEEEE